MAGITLRAASRVCLALALLWSPAHAAQAPADGVSQLLQQLERSAADVELHAPAGHILKRVIAEEVLVDPVRALGHRFTVEECQPVSRQGDRIVQRLPGESICA